MSTTMRTASAMVACSLLVAACTSERHSAFERLATKLNPIITALRPDAATILSPQSDDRTIIAACQHAMSELQPLWTVSFDDEALDLDSYRPSPAFYADHLLKYGVSMCPEDGSTPGRVLRCSDWCLERWISLAHSVEHTRRQAKKAGVEIVPLMP